jgi:hypothetical protein
MGQPHEPYDHPVWRERAKQLAQIVQEPLTPKELYAAARKAYQWDSSLISNTLAAADGRLLFFVHSKWVPLSQYHRRVMGDEM